MQIILNVMLTEPGDVVTIVVFVKPGFIYIFLNNSLNGICHSRF